MPAVARAETAKSDDVRVVIVDDSVVVRHVVADVIEREEGVTVAAMAANGREALKVVERVRPHVVVLDVEMPVLDGLGALRELKRRWPMLPVIMFSTLTERGAAATLQALAEGADDYMTKPVSTTGPVGAFDAVSEGLVPLLRSWGGIARSRESRQQMRARGETPGQSSPAAAKLRAPASAPVAPTPQIAAAPAVPVPPQVRPRRLVPGSGPPSPARNPLPRPRCGQRHAGHSPLLPQS